jgi:hypothetical protein
MYAARLVIVLLLVLAVIVAYNPQTRQQVMGTWEKIRPALVNVMDNLYIAVRNLVNGIGSKDRMHEMPAPGPGANFERIVTLRSDFLL